ncbi:thioester reductase domain-containing protein [Nocardia sp. NPDC050435]|uniref:thioester reductase domain-containing protein n=1 Tax=Nocardia sp. NPDC050435 TaxID=3155040 RepID=UPI0033ED4FCC
MAGPNVIPDRARGRGAVPPEVGADAQLDPSIVPSARVGLAVPEPRGVLLTGATGFLGAYLVHALAERTEARIYCLVRAADREAARDRVAAALRRYRLWSAPTLARVTPLAGDLAVPGFGSTARDYAALARKVDVVVHNGARVNHAEPYARLRAANVSGTAEVLRFACDATPKPVHFVSTTSVASATTRPVSTVSEADRPTLAELTGNGYLLGKWVGEELVAQAAARGLPAVIHRPDRVCGSPRTGAAGPDDAFWTMVRAAVHVGGVPPGGDAEVRLVPADYVAAALVHTVVHGTPTPVHHLINPTSMRLESIWERLRHRGFDLPTVPAEELVARLQRAATTDHVLAAALILAEGAAPGAARITAERTAAALAGSGLACPPMTPALLDRHLDYFTDTGFLPRPG